MRLQAKTMLTVAVLGVVGAVLSTAGSVRWLRITTEQEQDALAEAIAAQELFAAELVPAAPSAETARAPVRLPADARVTETLETLHALAENTEVVLTACRPTKTTDRGRVEFSVTGHAQGRALGVFLAQVEQHERVFAISAAHFRPATLERVGFDLTIVAFHQELGR